MGVNDFLDRVAAIEAKTEVEVAAPKRTWDADLIPDIPTSPRDPIDEEIDALLDAVTIDDAYVRWCGKMQPKIGRKRESVMVSCPRPEHKDAHPSAWLNLDSGLWYCGGCAEGGDKYDIAAWHFNYDVPGYKNDSFPQLRRDMAEDLGLAVRRTTSGEKYLVDVVETVEESPVGSESPEIPPSSTPTQQDDDSDEESSNVAKLHAVPDHLSDSVLTMPAIAWEELVPEGTFLRQYLKATSEDDSPEEFHFWNGITCVALAAGHDAVLLDKTPVHANLFVCLYGTSGSGKSRSTNPMQRLLRKALPYSHTDLDSTGVYITPVPGSAEALIDSFTKEIHGEDPKEIIGYAGVRGLVRFDELASLTNRANRNGSVLKSTLQELYDSYGPVEIKSRTAGVARAENHFCCVITTTQPGAVRDLLVQADADSGFINRIVFAAGPKKPRIPYGGTPIDIDALVQPLQRLRQWSISKKPRLVIEGEALDLFSDFFRRKIEPHQDDHERSLMTRVDLTLKKIILLFCINEESDPTADLVTRALRLYDYLEGTYRMLSEEIGVGQFEDCRLQLGKAIRRLEKETGGAVPTRLINRVMPRRYQRDLLLRVLHNMEEMGEIRCIEQRTSNRGPSAKLWAYVA